MSEDTREETVIAFTADHGEMHGEHGLGGHPQQFWEEVIHVPCAISIPGRDGGDFEEQMGLIDLPPTVLDAVDIDIPSVWDGNSMLPDTTGKVDPREHVFVDVGAELNRERAGLRRADGWKLMRHDTEGEFLINLNTNPQEEPGDNRISTDPETFESMSESLDRHLDEMEKRRKGEAGIEDEEMIEDHLKELGYLE
jgi:arylsulfatase A-like enzyme